jgi:TolB protein
MKKNIRSTIIIFLLFSSLFFGNTATVEAKIYIDVDSPTFQLFPIAICDFNLPNANTKRSPDTGIALAEEVKTYLIMTGFFNPLNKKSFIEEKNTGEARETKIDFSNWTMIGADYLLQGELASGEKETAIDCRLYDVIRGELILNKRYTSPGNDQKAVAKNIASDILFALTGDEGEFNTRIAYIAKRANKADIYTINYDGTERKNITNHQSIIVSPRWSPDGNFLAFTSFKNGTPEVYIRNIKNGAEKRVASFEGLNLCGYWSPDSQKILLTLSKDGNEEIYVLEIDTLKLKRLTQSYSIDVSPTWSPDGKKIAFVSDRGGSPQIYTMDADGNNVKRITFEGNYNTSPSWSPRGGRIAYEGLINGKYQIFTIDEEGNNLIQLTFDSADNESPSWAPSGRQIVYSSKTNAKSKIYIMNANGLNARVVQESANSLAMPMWSPRLK